MSQKRNLNWLLSVKKFVLYTLKERRDSLVGWCKFNRLTITNTWLKVRSRRRHAWTSPGDKARNQIDFQISTKFQNAIKNSRANTGSNLDSDHNPVVARFRLFLKRILKPNSKIKYDFNTHNINGVRSNSKSNRP